MRKLIILLILFGCADKPLKHREGVFMDTCDRPTFMYFYGPQPEHSDTKFYPTKKEAVTRIKLDLCDPHRFKDGYIIACC